MDYKNKLNCSNLFNYCNRLFVNNIVERNSKSSVLSDLSNIKRNMDSNSPYLCPEKINNYCKVAEPKKQQKCNNIQNISVGHLNIHKANSDEITKTQNCRKKKVKKSVLTLPNANNPFIATQATVSDMNESEYDNCNDVGTTRNKSKRRPHKLFNKPKEQVENLGGDEPNSIRSRADYYNITDRINSNDNITKHLKRNYKAKKNNATKNTTVNKIMLPHNIWTIFRNMNRIHFRESPVISEEDIVAPKKRNNNVYNNKNKYKEKGIFKTLETDEFDYISGTEIDSTTPNISTSSSVDRLTVIDNESSLMNTHDKVQKHKVFSKPIYNSSRESNIKTGKLNFENTRIYNIKNKNKIKSFDIDNFFDEPKNNERKQSTSDNLNGLKIINKNTDNKESPFKESLLNKPKYFQDPKCKGYGERQKKLQSVISNVENKYSVKNISTINLKQNLKKPQLVATMPITTHTINISESELKRRISVLKFPIVILEKDEVSPIVRSVEYEHPQFHGLDNKIWPYMINWFNNSVKKPNKSVISSKNHNKNKILNKNVEKTVDKSIYSKRNIITSLENRNHRVNSKYINRKSSIRLKELQMLELFYNKPVNDAKDEDKDKIKENYLDASTQSNLPNNQPKSMSITPIKSFVWSKSKQCNETIDNVINKIKHGVYCSFGNLNTNKQYQSPKIKKEKKRVTPVLVKNVIIPTRNRVDLPKSKASTSLSLKNKKAKNELHIMNGIETLISKYAEIFNSIPGFDQNLQLKINTLNESQIVLNNCVTNVTIEFDVNIISKTEPLVTDNLQSNYAVAIPFTMTSTNIYKCKTPLANAMLPEQLCTILPLMLCDINEDLLSRQDINKSDQKNLDLIPIPEFSPFIGKTMFPLDYHYLQRHKSQMNFQKAILNKEIDEKEIAINKVKGANESGRFGLFYGANVMSFDIKTITLTFSESSILLPKLNITNIFMDTIIPKLYLLSNQRVTLNAPKPISNSCTAVVPYTRHNILKSHYQPKSTIRWLLDFNSNHLNKNVHILKNTLQCSDINPLLSFSFIRLLENKNMLTSPNYCMNYDKLLSITDLNNGKICSYQSYVSNNKEKKGSDKDVLHSEVIMKNNTKFKSSNKIISNEPCPKPLNEICTFEDFLKVLGLENKLSSVLDRQYGEKILSSIHDFSSYTSIISPKQALLIFLLANKNKSLNSMKSKKIILQGIAVNRITLASELDVELEVIEREKIEVTPNEEISVAVENYDNLTEELCWIAKTTASDNQKPFDDNTKLHLEYLVSKRKSLNPSYLRLMARYVGLGLLKAPREICY